MSFTKVTNTGIGSTGTVLLQNLDVIGIATAGFGVSTVDVFTTGITSFANTTDSTSSTTGSVIVSGGVGIAGSLNVGGSVSVGGTLTYEDVTNVDSVGLITARNGIVVGSGITLSKDGDVFATGIATVATLTATTGIVTTLTTNTLTANSTTKVGSGVTLSPDGDIFATGITTVSENLMVGDIQTPEKTFHVHGNALIEDTIGNNFEIRSTVNNGNDPNFYFSKARGGGTPAIVQNGDDIGNLQWQGYDGDSYEVGASILGEVDGTPSDGDMPMRLTFKTRSAGAGSEQGRLRIHADGLVSLENNSNLQIPDKIIHSGDVNTAIRFPADDTFSVETVGSERLRITSDGNVGINFTAPTAKLEVSASNQAGLRIIDSHTNQAAPYIEVIGKRTDTNNSQSFGGQIFLAGNVTDAKVHSGKTLGAVLFGGNHTDGSLSNIAYPASIAAVASDSFDSVTDMPTDLIFLTGVTGRTPTTANVASGSERLRITSSGDVLIGGTAEITDVKVRVVGNMAQSNEDTGTGATMKTYVLSRSYTMSTSGTNVLTFDNWGTSAFDISVFRRDNQSPAGAQLSKVYLAFHGSGTNITQATLAQENKVIRGSIHSISYSISENNNTATLIATGDDNGGETQDLTFYILARGNALGQIVVA